MARINIGDTAAQIHYDMVCDERNGYSQGNRWGGQFGTKTLQINDRQYSYPLGDYDCSSSVIRAWSVALEGTPYEGALRDATYTGDIRRAFLNSGLFKTVGSWEECERGDLYLAEGKHVAMCQTWDPYDWCCLSEFNRNEYHTATGGQPGDQDGQESVIRSYYDDGWNVFLHYNGAADYDTEEEEKKEPIVIPVQSASEPKNNLDLCYRAHVANAPNEGWFDPVHDGMIAGSEGYGARLEAIKIAPPEGVVLDAYMHVAGIGSLYFDNILRGANDPVIGTMGQARQAESFMLVVKQLPDSLKGKKLKYQGHVQNTGWTDVCEDGHWCGTRGQALRLEAVRIWFE